MNDAEKVRETRSDGDIIRQGFFEYVRDSGLNTNSVALAAAERLEARIQTLEAALREIQSWRSFAPQEVTDIARRALAEGEA